MNEKQAEELGYFSVRRLPTGELAGLQQMLFTVGLFVGLDETGYRSRFCYPSQRSAQIAINYWDGEGDPPGPWIVEKGRVERQNPNADQEK